MPIADIRFAMIRCITVDPAASRTSINSIDLMGSTPQLFKSSFTASVNACPKIERSSIICSSFDFANIDLTAPWTTLFNWTNKSSYDATFSAALLVSAI